MSASYRVTGPPQGERRRPGRDLEGLRPERRRTYAEAAIRAFASSGGYHGTTLDGVARHAGVTQPRISQVYGSKIGAFLAAHDLAVERLVTAITAPTVSWDDIAERHTNEMRVVFGAWVTDNPEVRAAAEHGLEILALHLDAIGAAPDRIRSSLAEACLVTAMTAS